MTDDQNACAFKRLSLYLFRPTEIEEILCKTQVQRRSIETLSQRWGLTTEEDVTEAAQLLFERSSGYLRVICQFVQKYTSYTSFKNAKYPKLDRATRNELHPEFRLYRSVLCQWLISDNAVDWTEDVQVGRSRRVEPSQILRRCKLGWEGALQQATIVALPEVKREILNLVYPFRDYVKAVASTGDYPTPDLSEVFQWMFVKRWSELFADASVPKERLPDFFKENTVFGEYPGVHFSADIALLPQIQPGTSISALYASPLIEAETANVEDWPQLMREISSLLDCREDESFCFKFRTQSLSTDAFLVMRNRGDSRQTLAFRVGKKRPRVLNCDTRTLTIGLAVRALDVATSGYDSLHRECEWFNAMFEALDEDGEDFGSMTNGLVVGATSCSDKLKSLNNVDHRLKLLEDFDHVSDIVLVDLTTSEKRAEFFGFVGSVEENQFLIDSVDKFVDPW